MCLFLNGSVRGCFVFGLLLYNAFVALVLFVIVMWFMVCFVGGLVRRVSGCLLGL